MRRFRARLSVMYGATRQRAMAALALGAVLLGTAVPQAAAQSDLSPAISGGMVGGERFITLPQAPQQASFMAMGTVFIDGQALPARLYHSHGDQRLEILHPHARIIAIIDQQRARLFVTVLGVHPLNVSMPLSSLPDGLSVSAAWVLSEPMDQQMEVADRTGERHRVNSTAAGSIAQGDLVFDQDGVLTAARLRITAGSVSEMVQWRAHNVLTGPQPANLFGSSMAWRAPVLPSLEDVVAEVSRALSGG